MDYYVYIHRRKKDGSIFYIGKGKERRAYSDKGRNPHWKRIVEKDTGFDVEIVKEGLSNEQSCAFEKKLIKEIGIENLTNQTKGGDGGDTRIKLSHRQFRQWIMNKSNAQKGKTGYWKGKKRPEHSEKIKEIAKTGIYKNNGKFQKSELHKKRISEANKKPKPRVICDRCGMSVPTTHLSQHQKGKNCIS